MVKIPNLLSSALVPHQLDGGNVHLRVYVWEAKSVASVDQLLCLLPSQSEQPGGTFPEELGGSAVPHLPMQAFIQEHLGIHMPLHFPKGQAIPTFPLLGSEGFVPLVPIPQL